MATRTHQMLISETHRRHAAVTGRIAWVLPSRLADCGTRTVPALGPLDPVNVNALSVVSQRDEPPMRPQNVARREQIGETVGECLVTTCLSGCRGSRIGSATSRAGS